MSDKDMAQVVQVFAEIGRIAYLASMMSEFNSLSKSRPYSAQKELEALERRIAWAILERSEYLVHA